MSTPATPPTIETRSIDYVPRAERRGKVWHQGPFWFTGNFVILTMLVGFTGPSMGLSVPWTVLAIVLGAGSGTFFMAFHANQGPRMGLPQMIQSRAQFGSRGAIIPFIATVFVYVGFMVFDTIIGTQGIQTVAPGGEFFWYPVLIIVSIVIAIVGHDLLHIVQRWLTYVLIVVFGIVTVLAIFVLPTAAGAPGLSAGWDTAGFFVQLSLAAGFNLSYSVYVSDYSRYLPENAPAGKLIGWTYAGAAGSAIWLMSLGAVLSSKIPNVDGIPALQQTGDLLFPGFGTVVVLVGSVALITIMGVNAYGAMLTGISAVDGFKRMRPTVSLRVVSLTIVGLLTLIVALSIPDDYLDSFNSFVTLMLYFLVPWTAVNLVDFYLVRHGRYAITEIFNPNGVYGRWAWRGLVSYAAGFIVAIPFFSLPVYTGPVAQALGGADLSFVPAIIVSGGLYYVLTRSQDRSGEEAAIVRSERSLEGGH